VHIGIKYISDGIKTNSNLRFLNFAGCNFGKLGSKSLSNGLKEHVRFTLELINTIYFLILNSKLTCDHNYNSDKGPFFNDIG